MAYMANLVVIFVSGAYLAVIHKIYFIIACVLVCVCKNLGSLCPLSVLAICL